MKKMKKIRKTGKIRKICFIQFICSVFFLASLSMACSTAKVEQVYKPSATNVFNTECVKSENNCMKQARKHCDGDFEVLNRDVKSGNEENAIYTLEFRCI